MKRSFVLFSFFAVLVLVVSACGGAATTAAPAATQAPAVAKEPVTIKAMIRPDEGNNVADYSAKFTAQTGIKVDVTFAAWAEIHDKSVTTMAGGGGGYDIVFIPSADAAAFQAGGWFENVDDVIPAGERDQWLKSVVDLYTGPDGHLFAMPWYSGGAHMAYNKDIIAKAGIDVNAIKTWDDFLAACQVIQDKGAAQWCFTPSAKYAGEFYFSWGTIALGYGTDFFAADATPLFGDTDGALKAFQFVQDGAKKKYFDPGGVAMDDYETLIAFGTGNTAFLLNSTWSVTQANKPDLSKIPDKVGIMLIPGSGTAKYAQFMYAGGLGILKTAEHKEEAKQFLKFLTAADAQKDHAIKGANAPTRVPLFSDPDIPKAWPNFDMLAKQLSYGRFAPTVPFLDEWRRSALAPAFQDAMADRKTPEEALKFLTDETARIRNQ